MSGWKFQQSKQKLIRNSKSREMCYLEKFFQVNLCLYLHCCEDLFCGHFMGKLSELRIFVIIMLWNFAEKSILRKSLTNYFSGSYVFNDCKNLINIQKEKSILVVFYMKYYLNINDDRYFKQHKVTLKK